VREDDDGEAKNWHGNLNLHGWAFDRLREILTYNAKLEGIEVNEVDERDTSKTSGCAERKTCISVLNAVCTCARNTMMRSMRM
jgi:transposase